MRGSEAGLTRYSKHISLLIPGLFGPQPVEAAAMAVEGLTLPALETILSRGDSFPVERPDDTLEGAFFASFSVTRGKGDWPVAAVTRALDAGTEDKRWHLRADPVHLRPDRTDLRVFDASAFSLTRPEAEALAAEINAHFAGESWRIEVFHPERWYLQVTSAPALRTHPLSQVVGAHIDPFLPTGPDRAKWHRVLNELQMLLHASPVNEQRIERGELPINSLWLWGGGVLPSPPKPRWRQVWSDHALALGLARLTKTPRAGVPANGDDWLARAVTNGDHLLLLESGFREVCFRDLEGWARQLAALHDDWIAPLSAAVKRRELESLTLLSSASRGYRVTRGALRRWWRRRRPFKP